MAVGGLYLPEIKGGCLCGKVRYSANAEPTFVGLCHCQDCQKYTGSAFAVAIGVPKAAVTVQGQLTSFTKRGDSGKAISRNFCPECGSPIVDEAEALPGVAILSVGSLDDPNWVKPTSEIYCASAQPWVKLGGEMKRFDKAPA
jgi:hypothetical protein